MLEHVVVGMGMSALGVVEGLIETNNQSILVVDAPEKEIEYSLIDGVKRSLGQIGLGGNSELWHGVISIMDSCNSEKYREAFKNFLNKYYPNSTEKLGEGYSFIPFNPMRPKKIITTNFKDKVDFLFEKLQRIEILEDSVKLYFENKIITTRYLWLCTGATGTFQILNKSNYVNKTNDFFLDDHLVGYFGQIKRNQLSAKYMYNILYSSLGHFKKFHTLKLSSGKKMYLNLRPAHFSFKDLDVASDSRSFFGQNSTSIIKKLFTTFNLGLILEAFYNKFGLSIKSNIYNLVGHVEIKNILKYSFNDECLEHINNEVEFSNEDLKEINEYFGCQVNMKNKVKVSPGIHFMNLKSDFHNKKIDDNLQLGYSDSNVILCSGLSLKIESPEHPTFSLLVYSYLKAKSLVTKAQ